MSPSHNQPIVPERNFRSIIFIDNITYKFCKKIKERIPNLVLSYRSPDTIKSIFTRLKDHVDNSKRSNVIYFFPCKECDEVYVGLTTQLLKSRIDQHRYDKNRFDRLIRDDNTSNMVQQNQNLERISQKTAVIKHIMDSNHSFSYDDVKILVTDNSYEKLKIWEMLYIKTMKTVNLRTDVDGLSIVDCWKTGLLRCAR